MLNEKLKEFRALYSNFDEGHKEDHFDMVVARTTQIIIELGLDVSLDMAITVAACHDIGLISGDRKNHHIISKQMVLEDKDLSEIFEPKDLITIAEACEDHRASGGNCRSIYGKIVADADRIIDPNIHFKRCMENKSGWSFKALSDNIFEHSYEKYGDGGYAKWQLPNIESDVFQMKRLSRLLGNRKLFDSLIKDIVVYHNINIIL